MTSTAIWIKVHNFYNFLLQQEEQAAAKVYEEFIESFEDGGKSSLNRSWVKGGVVNPELKSKSLHWPCLDFGIA